MSDFVHRRLRAPTGDGVALIDPPLSQAPALIERNRAIGIRFDQTAGFPLNFRTWARLRSIAGTGDGAVMRVDAGRPLILAGHQPELFHPGVWFKNFVLDAVARSCGGVGVNLAVDNDVVRSVAIGVPDGAQPPLIASVPFDAEGPPKPWDRRPIVDQGVFRRFGDEVLRTFGAFAGGRSYRSGLLIERVWPAAIAAMEQRLQFSAETYRKELGEEIPPQLLQNMVTLGDVLAAGRHHVERKIGLRTSEFPLSSSLDRHFLLFADHLLGRHAELLAVHNAALAEHRLANGVRSAARPVPDLARDGDWYEAPFWICVHGDGRRRRAFVRRYSDGWEITDREGTRHQRPGSSGDDSSTLSRALREAGFDLRPRALITTMYARLVLSDLFIHGIGGAKYDEVTDLIIRRFFGVEPPGFITATATFRLPIERPQVTLADVRDSARRIREARFRPESFVREPLVTSEPDLSAKLAALAAEKREFLDQHDLRRCEPAVFARLDALNRAMHELLQPVERSLRARHAELVAFAKQSQLLGSRDFSFVLFPSEILPARLLDLCKVSS